MKLLLVSWGRGLGHITRCLAVAVEANRQGGQIQVHIVTDGRNATLIEQVVCTSTCFPEDLTVVHPWEGWNDSCRIERFLEADLEILEAVKPDVVLHDVRPTIPIACELANIPCAMFAQCDICPGFLYPGQLATSIKWTSMLPAINEVLVNHGLQPAKNDLRELFCRHTILIPSIPEFDSWSKEATDAQIAYTGPLLLRAGDHSCINVFNGAVSLPVVFVYGVIQSQKQLDQLINAFCDTPFHLLIAALPENLDTSKEEYLTSQVSFSPFVDIVEILPKCVAAIIHGGHGSCMSVLASGVPAVVIPGSSQEVERIYNGQLLEALGGALCVPGEVDWNVIYSKIDILIRNDEYKLKAQNLEKEVKKMQGAKYALEVLASLAP